MKNKLKQNFAATPYTFTLFITAGDLEKFKGAMDEEERLELIRVAKEETDDENAQLAARTDDEWRKEAACHIGRPYGWWSLDKEKQEAWIQAEVDREKAKAPYTWETYDLEDIEFSLPAVDIPCHRCQGSGSHVNPSIDGNGITESEWSEWSEDEREGYFRGDYDVSCHACEGTKFVKEIVDACYLSEPQKVLLKMLERKWRSDAEYARECAMERRAGA